MREWTANWEQLNVANTLENNSVAGQAIQTCATYAAVLGAFLSLEAPEV